MRAVSRFESDLLHIARALVGGAPREPALRRIVDRRPAPPCLGRPAVELVRETLATGCVVRLARAGGWLRTRHLRGEAVADGRLWDRSPPSELGLEFSRHALEFLIWLTADHPGDRPARWDPPPGAPAVGDRVLTFLAYEVLRDGGVGPALADRPALAGDGLCRLAFPGDFADNRTGIEPDFGPWVSGAGAAVLEALQPRLAELWAAGERPGDRAADAGRVLALGRARRGVVDAFLRALDAAGRWDLARFLLVAAAGLLRGRPQARDWVGSLDLRGLRLADRAAVHRAALAGLDALEPLRDRERRARGVGYFDEGYAAAQLWKADWERLGGDALVEHAGAIRRELDPLGVGPDPGGTTA